MGGPVKAKCKGCGRVWGAAGSEGQCSRCRRCLTCCSDPKVERSCVAREQAKSPAARARSQAARERFSRFDSFPIEPGQ
jgi:hypothetical protein